MSAAAPDPNAGGMRRCPFCAEPVPPDAVMCGHCRERIDARHDAIQPVWKIVLLSAGTAGAYQVYWAYRAWQVVRIADRRLLSPGWRALGLLVPILNIVLLGGLFADIRRLAAAHARVSWRPWWLAAGAIAGWTVAGRAVNESTNHGPLAGIVLVAAGAVASLSGGALLGVAHRTWAEYRRAVTPDAPVSTRLSGGEIAVLAGVAALWAVVAAAALLTP